VTCMPKPIVAAKENVRAADYEELRRSALGSAVEPIRGIGFALFLRGGMAGWMEACAALPRSVEATSPA